MTDKDSVISISSMVSHRTLEPMVHIKWGEMEGVLSPEEAMEHAANVIEVVSGAFADAFLVKFVKERIGVTEPEKIGSLLVDFRSYRQDRVLSNVVQAYEEESE